MPNPFTQSLINANKPTETQKRRNEEIKAGIELIETERQAKGLSVSLTCRALAVLLKRYFKIETTQAEIAAIEL